MDQFEKQKIERQALNGKMTMMFGGIFLMFSAITSTLMYGINFFMTAQQADKGVAEYVELLKKAGVGSTFLRVAGVCFLLVGIYEIIAGFITAKNSNRIDKSLFTMKIIISLLIVEIMMQVYLFLTGLMNFGFLFTAILLPLFMLWGVTRLRKDARRIRSVLCSKPAARDKSRQQSALQRRVFGKERLCRQERMTVNQSNNTTEKVNSRLWT